MTQPTLLPRPDHIAELTRGIARLPLPPLDEEHIRIVFETIVDVWKYLQAKYAAALAGKSETEINDLMASALKTRIDEDPLFRLTATAVARDASELSYDGTHLDKKPDLSIQLTQEGARFPLTVECKLIDAPNKKKTQMYCDNGVRRHVAGEYAWARQEALMLGYVRDGSSIAGKLTPALKKAKDKQPDPYATLALPEPQDFQTDVARSRHGRDFKYISAPAKGDPPGPIDLWHVWVS
ncbi:MAG TPA: hypothetical protein PKZ97_09070 [Azospirillaceae bacterium]|nr:hypothetical protein [Azospirillaceae bacterium]HRQ81258.1 hypothetical protein [Azospirillaceae bacterium]